MSELAKSSAALPVHKRAARVLDCLIFFALLALIAVTASPYGTVTPLGDALFACVVFALAGLWIIEGLLEGAWQVGGYRLLAPLLVLIAFALVQTLPWPGPGSEVMAIESGAGKAISADPYATQLFAIKLLALTLAGTLLYRYTSSQERLRALVYVVIGVGLVSALFGPTRAATERDAPGLLDYLKPGFSYGQFINRNHFALLMEMALGLVLGLIIGGGARRSHLVWYILAAIFLWTALVLANSRGGVFSMLSQLFFLALLTSLARTGRTSPARSGERRHPLSRLGKSFIVRAALTICLLVAVTAGIVLVGGDALMNRLETVPRELSAKGDDYRTNARRLDIWRATWELVKANPIAGVGFGGYHAAISTYHDASGRWKPDEAHNDYLELLASGGLIGAAIGAWFIIALIRGARERFLLLLRSSNSFRRAACLGALAGLFAVAVHSFVDFGLHVTINALVFTTLVVIATLNGRVEKMRASG